LCTGGSELGENQRDHDRNSAWPQAGPISAPAANAASMIGGVIAV
jgi:hypothetical protein